MPDSTLIETLRSRLRDFPHTSVPDTPGMRRATVVICVVDGPDGTPGVIVIRRAYQGRNAGQWGLPGGRMEPGEAPVQTGLRELSEELGLALPESDVLGRLDDFPASSGFAITPLVVVPTAPGPLHPSPDEVHSVHLATLTRLAADDTPHWVIQHDARPGGGVAPSSADNPDGTRLLQMRLAEDMVIHAPTGAMLWQFREVCLLGHPPAESRVATFLQPDWTRR